MAHQQQDNKNKEMDQNIDMNKSGSHTQSPNVTGVGETSRQASQSDIGTPDVDTQDPHRARETGRADTDINSDIRGDELASDS